MNRKEVLPYIGLISRVKNIRLGVLELEGGDLIVEIPDGADQVIVIAYRCVKDYI